MMTNNDLQSYAALNSKRKPITQGARLRVAHQTPGLPTSDISEAIAGVVVNQAGGLHEGVTDSGAHEAEAAALQVFAHGV
jgi:hypothetical protein